jgi:ABC-type iron transport system FetAB ATPase subunit
VLDAIETAQVVIVTGPAGSGKSAIAKDAADMIAPDHFLFAFRVEEFAQPYFDATLNAAQVPASRAKLAAILAAQDRKDILIESVERLLEKATCRANSWGGNDRGGAGQ